MAHFWAVEERFFLPYKSRVFQRRRSGAVGKRCVMVPGVSMKQLESWRDYVKEQGAWQVHKYEGYRPLAVDLTAFWRLRLKGWMGKYFNGLANRMVKGIGFALVVEVGQLAGQRLPLLRKILRAEASELSQKELKQKALSWVGKNLEEEEVLVFDAGAHISELQSASVKRYVLRLASNCTARRNYLPEYSGRGRKPQYGQRVRPLPRQRKGQTLAATEPDWETSFELDGRTIRVHSWHNLVLSEVKVDPERRNFFHLGLF